MTINTDILNEATAYLREGKFVIFPTETVYGIACDAMNADAVRKLAASKHRPADKKFPLMTPDTAHAFRLFSAMSERDEALLRMLWPGPLTAVHTASSDAPAWLCERDGTIGMRCPAHPFALALLRAWDGFLCVPSANLSGMPPATSAEDAEALIAYFPDALIVTQPEPCGGSPSTVVRLNNGERQILRDGELTESDFRDVLRLRSLITGQNEKMTTN